MSKILGHLEPQAVYHYFEEIDVYKRQAIMSLS